jgi:transcriptional regulator with XRE-family HTH domain
MKNSFRENLRLELDYQGITVKELSAKTGVAKGTLDSYLGVRASMPPADIAVRIAQSLGVSVEYLISGIEHQKGLPLFDQNIRSIIAIITKLNGRDNEIMLGLARVLEKQAEAKKAGKQKTQPAL